MLVSSFTLLKQYAKSVVLGSRALLAAQLLVPIRVLILRYHSVRELPADLDPYISIDITHSAVLFRAQMEYVARTCHPITLDDIPGFVTGSRPIPRRAVAVTFDDGYRDNYEVAAPILEQYSLPGNFYVSTSSVEGRPLWFVRLRYWMVKACISRPQFLEASSRCATLSQSEREEYMATLEHANSVSDSLTMSWSQARSLLDRGHVIGSHTVHHPNMAKISPEELQFEMKASRTCLEEKLGSPIHHFSYPNPILSPHWNEETLKASRLAGYTTAVTSTDGHVKKGTNPLALPRQSAAQNLKEFVWNLEIGFCGADTINFKPNWGHNTNAAEATFAHV